MQPIKARWRKGLLHPFVAQQPENLSPGATCQQTIPHASPLPAAQVQVGQEPAAGDLRASGPMRECHASTSDGWRNPSLTLPARCASVAEAVSPGRRELLELPHPVVELFDR